jgi:hypothetical protein
MSISLICSEGVFRRLYFPSLRTGTQFFCMLLSLLLKNAAIEYSAYIILTQHPILGPEKEVHPKPLMSRQYAASIE